MWIKGGKCSDVDRKTIVHRGVSDPHSSVDPGLFCAMQHVQHRLQACAMPHISLAAAQTQPVDGNGGACRQLPLGTGTYIFILLALINNISMVFYRVWVPFLLGL